MDSTDPARTNEIAGWAKEEFTDPNGPGGAVVTISGDDMRIAGMLIDDGDEDPVEYLRTNPLKFTVPTQIEVLLDEDDEVYYRLTFLKED